jgi:hypothetical protein
MRNYMLRGQDRKWKIGLYSQRGDPGLYTSGTETDAILSSWYGDIN